MLQFEKPDEIIAELRSLSERLPEAASDIKDLGDRIVQFARTLEHTARNHAGKETLKAALAEAKLRRMTDERDRLANALQSTEEQLMAIQKAAHEAHGASITDALTGLLNRRGWDTLCAEMDTELRRGREDAAIVYMDLNDLRVVNNTKGHHEGDELIKKAADTLRSLTRKGDFAARIGGDEFVLFAHACCGNHCVEALVTRLQEGFQKEGVSISIGASVRSKAGSLNACLREADKRMFAAKHKMKSGVQ